jgi:hypothetical protein
VINAQGGQSRFAFARNSPAIACDSFMRPLGGRRDGCDGDAGLWRLQCEALPNATVVLDWWHVAVRFEHALQTARGPWHRRRTPGRRGSSWTGMCEVAPVARALAGMPAQTRGALPLGAA